MTELPLITRNRVASFTTTAILYLRTRALTCFLFGVSPSFLFLLTCGVSLFLFFLECFFCFSLLFLSVFLSCLLFFQVASVRNGGNNRDFCGHSQYLFFLELVSSIWKSLFLREWPQHSLFHTRQSTLTSLSLFPPIVCITRERRSLSPSRSVVLNVFSLLLFLLFVFPLISWPFKGGSEGGIYFFFPQRRSPTRFSNAFPHFFQTVGPYMRPYSNAFERQKSRF